MFCKDGRASANSIVNAQLVGVALSHQEHFRTTQSSLLPPFYLLSTIICDAVRIRTFAMAGFLHSQFFVAVCATFATRCLWFGTENLSKGWLVQEARRDGPVSQSRR